MEQEHVLPQLGQVRVRLDARPVVRLREQLDVERQPEHGPGRFAEHRAGDVVRLRLEAVARGHVGCGHLLEAAEQLLVLELFVGQTHQRFEGDLVAEPVALADLERLRADVALHQPEDVGVGAALDLRHEAHLAGLQKSQLLDLRHAVGHELLVEVEAAAANHVAVDVPADSLRRFDALRIALRRLLRGFESGCIHDGDFLWRR